MAISMGLNTRRGTAVATATRLPRYARNDKVGTHEAGHVPSTHFNLDGVEHTSGNRRCYGDEIAALRSQ